MAAFSDLLPPTQRDLMEVVGVDVQADWDIVGLALGLNSATLKSIKTDYSGAKNCMAEVFTQWHDGGTREYSWSELAEVLSSRTVNKVGILPGMLDKIKKQSNCS